MKKIKIYACLIVALLLLDSCVHVCVESEKKFVNSTSKYPNLTAVKVDDLKNKINQDNNFKIIYIYEVCDNLFGKYISENIIPYTEKICDKCKEIVGTHRSVRDKLYYKSRKSDFN